MNDPYQIEESSDRGPVGADLDRASVSRVYDAYLEGAAHQRADRAFAARVRAVLPDVQALAVANRRFLARAVDYAVGHGVDQIIDIGAGVPSIWQTHHVARRIDPAARVVYVDHEAVAYHALCAATADDPGLGAVRADVRDVQAVLSDPVTADRIDGARPVVLVLGLLLHFLADRDDPAGLLRGYRDAVAPGSYLVLSHATSDGRAEAMGQVARLYASIGRPIVPRSQAELAALVAGFEVVAPGIVHIPVWRPDPDDPVFVCPERSCAYALVART